MPKVGNMTDYNYPGTYQEQTLYKTAIRERDNYTCQLCGEHPAFDVDHIIPYHISKDNSESNLRVLCHSCNLTGRRYTLPEGKIQRISPSDYGEYLMSELAKCSTPPNLDTRSKEYDRLLLTTERLRGIPLVIVDLGEVGRGVVV